MSELVHARHIVEIIEKWGGQATVINSDIPGGKKYILINEQPEGIGKYVHLTDYIANFKLGIKMNDINIEQVQEFIDEIKRGITILREAKETRESQLELYVSVKEMTEAELDVYGARRKQKSWLSPSKHLIESSEKRLKWANDQIDKINVHWDSLEEEQ